MMWTEPQALILKATQPGSTERSKAKFPNAAIQGVQRRPTIRAERQMGAGGSLSGEKDKRRSWDPWEGSNSDQVGA
jgi:hypothetical protein